MTTGPSASRRALPRRNAIGQRGAAAALVVVAFLAAATPSHAANGTDPTRISLPSGPGSIEGLGKNFVPSLASGTASFGIDIVVPPASGGFAPKLSFAYEGGSGVSELGMGWRFAGTPRIRRRVDNGLPKFD